MLDVSKLFVKDHLKAIEAIKAIRNHSFLFAIVIGIIKTSGGIGNIKLSIKDINPRIDFELLWPASLIDF